MEKKGMLEQRNSKIYIQHAVMEKQIMTGLRHRNIVQVVLQTMACYASSTPSEIECAEFSLISNVCGHELDVFSNNDMFSFNPQLHYAFQTNSKLYMVIDLCPGGTL